MSDFTLTIDGKAVAADDGFGVINPSTGEVIAHAPQCTAQEVESAVLAAKEAFPEWSDTPVSKRVAKPASSSGFSRWRQRCLPGGGTTALRRARSPMRSESASRHRVI